MFRPMILNDAKRAEIVAAVNKARKSPVPWEKIRDAALPEEHEGVVTMADKKGRTWPDPITVLIEHGYRMAVSFEHQPAGLILHVSLSVRDGEEDALPSPQAMAMVARTCGFPAQPDRTWIEEFSVGEERKKAGLAINALWLVEPNEPQGGMQ